MALMVCPRFCLISDVFEHARSTSTTKYLSVFVGKCDFLPFWGATTGRLPSGSLEEYSTRMHIYYYVITIALFLIALALALWLANNDPNRDDETDDGKRTHADGDDSH